MKNQLIICESVQDTFVMYIGGHLDDNSIHEDYRSKGINFMKSLVKAIGQFKLITKNID